MGQFDVGGAEICVDDGVSGGGLGMGTIEEAVRVLLVGLGEDYEREGLRKTPVRVAKAFIEGTRGYRQNARDIVEGALFPEAGIECGTGQAGGAGGLVAVRDINLFSYCESCLLPFRIQCHVGYVPSRQRVVGLSKLSRVADVFAKRLQEPQRLADEICLALQNSISPAGIFVALQCWHIPFPRSLNHHQNAQLPFRSSMQGWVRTRVSSSSGVFNDKNSSFLDDFLFLLKLRGACLGDAGFLNNSWCPSMALDVGVTSHPPMVAAAQSILSSIGEDPFRKELLGTPNRYFNWLMNFRRSNLDLKQNGLALNSIVSHENLNARVNDRFGICSELNLPFCALCEHHLLPFQGVVHIGLFHDGLEKAIDRSNLQSMVYFYGCKLQVQERLTMQIAEAVYSVTGRGVMVVVEANHICMVSRGIEKVGSSTATIAVKGQFSTDSAAKALFLDAISKSTEAES
ncbi:GTP cyclohydrolase I [Apostasia shenzhenica]|uniref:GTP cyclohydrolase 1 n=1 Tax=Apostasia shenzhenica TaxID=1088818 RepID=A0A2H9ZVU6_9ASPA|nr:GTP cyclohydrolase I [Apostasia shenzhenica]